MKRRIYIALLLLFSTALLKAQPSAPSGLSALKGPKNIYLSWSQVTGSNIYYQIFRGISSGTKTLYIDSITSLNWLDTGAQIGIKYYYAVKAYNNSGFSPMSNEAVQSSNRIWYVSNAGNNANIGSETFPFSSPSFAISQSVDGDTVILNPGVYSERLNFSGKSIVFGSRYLLTSDTSYISSTKLDGFNVANTGTLVFESFIPAGGLRALVGFTITRSKTSALSLSNFIIRRMVFDNNALNDMSFNNVIYLYNSSTMDSCTVMNTTTTSADALMYLFNSSSGYYKMVIRNNRFINNTMYLGGIVFLHAEYSGESYFENNVILKMTGVYYRGAVEFRYLPGAFVPQKFYCRNNLISKTNMAAINLDNARNPDSLFIINNTITENLAGIQINADLTCYSRYVNNIVVKNGLAPLYQLNFNILNTPIFPTHKSVFKNNIIGQLGNGSAMVGIPNYDLLNIIDSSGNTIYDPMFRDTAFASYDYRLLNYSKIIAKGINDPWMLNYDQLAYSRPSPLGSNPEPGAYELSSKYISPILNSAEAGDKKVTLSWSPSASSGLITYRIIRSNASISDTATIGIIASGIPISILTYTDTSSLTNLVAYRYRIQAEDASGALTGLSNELICTPRIPPARVTQAAAIKTPRKIQLVWQVVNGTGITYQVFKGTSKQNLSLLKDSITETRYIDTATVPYISYYYAVRALDTYQTKGSFSDTLQAWSNRLWYVDTAGNNNYLGSEDSSFQSISVCINSILDGDTIILKQGTYKERINFGTKAFTIGSRYLLTHDTSYISKTTIDGSNAVNSAAVIFESATNNTVKSIVGLRLANSRGQFIGLSNVIVRRVIAENNIKSPPTGGAGSLFTLTNYFILDSSIIRNNNSAYYSINALPTSPNKSSEIRNNIFQDNQYEDCGLFFWGSSVSGNKIMVENNSFTGYKRIVNAGNTAIIRYYGTGYSGGQKFIFRNNVIAKNNSGGIYTDNAPNDSIYIINNTIAQNTMPGIGMNSSAVGHTWIVNNIISNIFGSNDELHNAGSNTQTHHAHFINNIIGTVKNPHSLLSIHNITYFNLADSTKNFAIWPNFVDTGFGLNYRLANNSHAIGNGNNFVNMPVTDIIGAPRIQPANSPVDLGAYESKYYIIAPDIDTINTNNSQSRIVWSNNSPNITKYLIYRGLSSGSQNYLAQVNAPLQSYVDSFPVLRSKNHYAVLAINNVGDSSGLGIAIGAIPLAPITMLSPTHKAVSQPLTGKLIWQKDSLASSYRFQFGTDSTFIGGLIKDSITTDTGYNYKNLVYNRNYYWRVRGINSTGFAAWPIVNQFQTQLRTPRIDSISTSHQRVFIRWNDSLSSNIQRYFIHKTNVLLNQTIKDSVTSGKYTYIDSNLTNGTLYRYEVEAMNNQGVLSAKSIARHAIPLDPPQLLSPANNVLTPTRLPLLGWNKYLPATKYRIQISKRSQFDTLTFDTIRPDSFFAVNKILLPNMYYFWRVQSIDSLGTSNFSSSFGFQTDMSIPNLISLTTSSNSIRLNWVDTGSANVSKYYIYRSQSPNASTLIDSINGGNFTYKDTTALNGTIYYYRIRTLSPQGLISGYSNERSASPYPITSTVIVEKGPWNNRISWNSVSLPGVKYQIYRGTSFNSRSLIKDSISQLSYIDTLVNAGTRYYYSIVSVDNQNNSSEQSQIVAEQPDQIWHVSKFVPVGGNGAIYSKLNSINLAVNSARIGDTILVYEGTYNERIDMNGKKLTIASWFMNTGQQNDIDSTIIDGNGLGVQPLFSDSKNKGFTLIGLHITRALQLAINSTASGIDKTNMRNLKISQSGSTAINGVVNITNGSITSSTFMNNTANILITAGTKTGNNLVQVDRCVFGNNNAISSIINAGYARVLNSVFYRNTASAVLTNNLTGASTDTLLTAIHNTLALNNAAAILTGGSVVSILENNLIAFNKTSIDFSGTSSFATLRWRGNLIAGLNSLSIPGTFTVFKTGNLDTIPSFKDTSLNNFELTSFSPGIGKAITILNAGNDLKNTSRPYPSGSIADIGAIENEYGFSGPKIDHVVGKNGKLEIKWSSGSGNISKFTLYRSTVSPASTLLTNLNSSSNLFIDSTTVPGVIYYYRISATDNNVVESGYSNEMSAASVNSVSLTTPVSGEKRVILNPTFNWPKNPKALSYQLQVALNGDFNTLTIDSTSNDTSLKFGLKLKDNQNYSARLRCINLFGSSEWSNAVSFTTRLNAPVIDSVKAGNHRNTIFWSLETSGGASRLRLMKDTAASFTSPKTIFETTNILLNQFTDSLLINNRTYHYKMVAFSADSMAGDSSNSKFGTPFNLKPIAANIPEKRLSGQGRKTSNQFTFFGGTSIDLDGKIDSMVWYVNGKRIKSDTSLNYGFRQGTSLVVLKVYDNDQAMDSSFGLIHINLFEYTLNGPIVGGLTSATDNKIYVADDFFRTGLGYEVTLLDSNGKKNISKSISVNFRTLTTPSITPEKSVLITNGLNLNGFDINSDAQFSAIQLSRTTSVTPTVDSMLNRLYVGDDGGNFKAYNYKTGGSPIWSFTADDSISASAVLTRDRKLIFPTVAGTLYGFNVKNPNAQGSPAQPKWQYVLGDKVNSSPAIDTAGNIYIGTRSGTVYKLHFHDTGSVQLLWNKSIGSRIISSPVIDASGFIYVGCQNGNFYKLNPFNGNIIWSFATGAPIVATPAISNYGIIYVSNTAGLLVALDTTSRLKWFYKDSTSIEANILHVKGTTYIGTRGGKVIAFWDKDLTTYGKADNATEPVWGTFQGNGQRTGTQFGPVDTTNSDTTFNAVHNIGFDKTQLIAYPNPADNEITVKSENDPIQGIQCFDLKGQLIFNKGAEELNEVATTISMRDLEPGMYLIRVNTKKGQAIIKVSVLH